MAHILTRDDIDHLATLARLYIEESEKDRMVTDLGGILDYVSELSQVASPQDMAPDAGFHRNVMRPDGEPTKGGVYHDAIIANAPDSEDGFIKVKPIF